MTDTPLDALVFDLGGVIVAHDNPVMYARLASRCAPAWSPADVAGLVGAARWGTGAPIRELHEQLRVDGGYAGGWETFVEDWCCHFAVDASMLALLEDLSRRNRVLIFSNTNAEHWAFLTKATGGRLGAFEAYLSHQIGCAKP
jgi:FMN phosphatase YigB (HAD superfamily)